MPAALVIIALLDLFALCSFLHYCAFSGFLSGRRQAVALRGNRLLFDSQLYDNLYSAA